MADEKISDMTAATEVANGDLLPIVQAGSNLKTTRSQLLTGATSEDIEMVSASGQQVNLLCDSGLAGVSVDDAGTAGIEGQNGASMSNSAVGAAVDINAVGGINVTFTNGQNFSIQDVAANNAITIIGAPGIIAITAAVGISIKYFAATPGDWSGGPSFDINASIDRLAAAVAGLLGGPIP